MSVFDWNEVKGLMWKQRNVVVRIAAMDFLNLRHGFVTTTELVEALAPADDVAAKRTIAAVLKAEAEKGNFGPRYATHDGEKVTYMGHGGKRWRWHGQLP